MPTIGTRIEGKNVDAIMNCYFIICNIVGY